LMWVHPFTAGGLDRVDVGDGLFVHWLMGMPITEAERIWLETNGYDAFIAKLENGGVNYTDLRRDSLV
ncbi:suppressor of fused domain protein, partial [Cutibacterium granulosum]